MFLTSPESTQAMPRMLAPGGTRFRLGIAAAPFALWDEWIGLIQAGLEPKGFQVQRIAPCDVASRAWDGLLWLGNGDGLEPYADASARLGTHRPPTLLWQLDPLPPPDLPPEAEKLGLGIARREGGRRPAFLQRLVRAMIPCRRQLMELAHRRDLRRLAGLGPCGREFAEPSAATVARLSRYWSFIRHEMERGTLDQVAASVPVRMEFLRRRGVAVTELPLGFHPAMGNDAAARSCDLDPPRDYDVVFLGTLRRTRRVRLLRGLGKELRRRGIRFLAVDRDCYGMQRTRLLSRTKIVLNVNTVPWDMPGFRFLTAVGCGALVVSEPIRDPSPYRPGEHYVEAAVSQLPDAIEQYLRDDAGRSAIVAAARRFLENEHSWDHSMTRLGSWFHAHSFVSSRGM